MNSVRKSNRTIFRLLAALLALSVVFCMAGCAGKTKTNDPGADRPTDKVTETGKETETEKETDAPEPKDQNKPAPDDSDFADRDDLAYVLIYNPGIYDENLDRNEKLSTGAFGEWVDAAAVRSGEVAEDPEFSFFSQGNFADEVKDMEVDLSGSRASVPQPTFKKGDSREFYYAESSSVKTGKFSCEYVGEHCCIWLMKGVKADGVGLDSIAGEFDGRIYDADVENFGEPRYADVNGKIHILFHPMENNTLGYFRPADLFSHDEATDAEAKQYGLNRDLALIHLNAALLKDSRFEGMIYSTLAHELQHLINFTDFVEYNGENFSSTWINESMSGYIEEKLYPGVKEEEGHLEEFARSEMIRHGQSMYNFDTGYRDIGVYGSVFLFSQYFEKLAGETVFKQFHDYWRKTFDPRLLTDAKALYACVPESEAKKIDEAYDFPADLSFSDDAERWMSKLTLDFYLSLLKYDSDDPEAYQNVEAQTLLYDEINPAEIEGGGRVIAATKDGRFEIPSDSDQPLVYIGFDKDFNQITNIVVR